MRCLGLLRQAGRATAAPLIPGLGDETELARRSPSTSLQARAADADAARGSRQGVPVGDAGSPHPMAVNEGAPSYNVIGLLRAGLVGHGVTVKARPLAPGR